jgi:SAM-dependent methyltransferase
MHDDVRRLTSAYFSALEANGDTPAGVLWPNPSELAMRFEVLSAPVRERLGTGQEKIRVLDLGCGPGLLLDYLSANGWLDRVDYTGVDVFGLAVDHARRRWPGYRFEQRDVREAPFAARTFDYCVICGAFTFRATLGHWAMRAMVQHTLKAVWPSLTLGLGFNVMSHHVDWERSDLFHWPLDEVMSFCKADLSRHVSMRMDYGLWETAVFVSKAHAERHTRVPECWSTPT